METSNPFSALGNKVSEFTAFETFDKPEGVGIVTMESDEVTANCPVTSAPDWYHVQVTYYPVKKCIESKTMKLYFQSFRNKGLFCEKFADQIADDVFKAIQPSRVIVRVVQKPRGGVSITASAQRGNK